MKKIYVAGPMTGLPHLNFPAFHAAAALLRAAGHQVVNPAEINADTSAAWIDCMRADITELVTCDAINLLPGWQLSRGATLEHYIATELFFEVHLEDGSVHAPTMNEQMHAWSGIQRARIAEMMALDELAVPDHWPHSRAHAVRRHIALALGMRVTVQARPALWDAPLALSVSKGARNGA